MRLQLPLERLAGLAGSERGLTGAEVAERRARYGPNDVVEVPEGAWRELLRDTARDPMLWFLVATSVLYAVLGETAEAVVLGLSLVPLAGMDAWLHHRTRASTAGLRSRLATRARVLRDGVARDVPIEDVVPGDLATVAPGEPFPADGVLVDAIGVQVDESSLTGESFPVHKASLAQWPDAAEAREVPVDAAHWGLAGTRVLTGTARLRVARTGQDTLYGAIVRSAVEGSGERTPLQSAIAALVRVLLVAALLFCALLAGVRLRQGFGLLDALVSAMTLAVAALPEEFPVVFAVFLGVGVHRMARRGALVRRAVSVEDVGRITTVCSDKTGTVTLGRLALAHVVPEDPAGSERVLDAAATASQAGTGDPLDEALLERHAAPPREVVARFPFSEDKRRESVAVADGEDVCLASKGSPEVVFETCAWRDGERADWERRVAELAADGYKVLAVATRRVPRTSWVGGEPDRGMRLEGLVSFEDPVRPGVREAVAECRRAGIRVVLVTGDHPATALAIAREIGLDPGERGLVLGADLEDVLGARTSPPPELCVVARAVPSQKLLLVRALQAAGERVAVTGDGVNDVPALQAADVGIAMGQRGTRSAREVASIVLLDDEFATIVHAIAEGRQLFRNLRHSFAYLLAIHVPIVLTAAAIPLLGDPLLYLPVHVVWLELVIHPTAMLVFQDAADGSPLARAEAGRALFFRRHEWAAIAVTGALFSAGVVLGYERALGAARDAQHARAAVLTTLLMSSAFVVGVLTSWRTRMARIVSLATVASAVLFVQQPRLARALHLWPLHADDWGLAALLAALACLPLLLTRRARAVSAPR